MGKAGYRKFLKKERAKVKLKGSKTPLPKGQNVTDTNFKVKKIVIKDQIKEHCPDELLSKKKLNIKDLLLRLKHHNTTVKLEALEGLTELFQTGEKEVLHHEVPSVIEFLCRLTLDVVPSVRSASCKLISLILGHVPEIQLSPLFPSLCSYLMCGLTHINNCVREDSLLLLDTLLTYGSSFCANEVSKLLPICLDLVSESSTGLRTLSLHLDTKSGAVNWRGKVLVRIRTLLLSVVKSREEERMFKYINKNKRNVRRIKWNENEPCYAPLYVYEEELPSNLNMNSDYHILNNNEFDYKHFSSALIPLLLDAFYELAPINEVKSEKSSCCSISFGAAAFLMCTVDIIQSLWDVMETIDTDNENVSWMKLKFGDLFTSRLILQRFPYSTDSGQNRIGKHKFKDDFKNIFKYYDIQSHCNNLNLKLGKLMIHLGPYSHWKKLISYIKNCLRAPSKLSEDDCKAITSCLTCIIEVNKSEEIKSIISLISKLCCDEGSAKANIFFSFLVQVAFNPKLTAIHCDEDFKIWLATLPKLLLRKPILEEHLDALAQLCPRNFPSLIESLDGYIEGILDIIPNANVINYESEEAQMKLSSLLFWVNDWDEELLNGIIRGLQNEYWGKTITKYIKEILSMISESSKSVLLAELLKSNQWWNTNIS